jgi:hypothetical protein
VLRLPVVMWCRCAWYFSVVLDAWNVYSYVRVIGQHTEFAVFKVTMRFSASCRVALCIILVCIQEAVGMGF